MAAYVRKKRVGDYEYHQLVESSRVEGKPRQKVLLHLGKYSTVDAALQGWLQEIHTLRRQAQEYRQSVPEGHAAVSVYRNVIARADSMWQRANDLEANLEKLRQLKDRGVV